MSSLRSELLGDRRPVDLPDFGMLLPSGWKAHDVSEKTERALLAQARQRTMAAHRPELQGMLEANTSAALAAARAQGAMAMIMPGPDTEGVLFAPASMLVSVREATNEYTLDDIVVDVVRNRGGQPLDENKRFVRWIEQRKVPLGGETVGAYSVVYLTPVPGTKRRKALQFTLSIAHTDEVETSSDELLAGWVALVDAHVGTFRWER